MAKFISTPYKNTFTSKWLSMMVIALLCTTNVWAEYSSNGWVFSVNTDGTATVSQAVEEVWEGTGNGSFKGFKERIESSLTVPSSVTSYSIAWDSGQNKYVITSGSTYVVTGFAGNFTSQQKTALLSVILPSSLETIGTRAFDGCTNLSSAVLPSSLTTIGEYAFNLCAIEEVTVPASVTSIGRHAFIQNFSLKKAVILNSVISWAEFRYCTLLEDVTISDNVTSIDSYAFSDCPNLKKITIPASVTNLDPGAFSGDTPLEELVYKAQIIPGNMFKEKPLVSAKLEGVETIGAYAFDGCTKLSVISLSSSLTTIGECAFRLCAIEEVTIPASVTSPGRHAFIQNYSLKKAVILNGSINWAGFRYCTLLEDVTMSDNMTSIDNYAFADCPNLKKITIPASVTNLDIGAFSGDTPLEELVFRAKVIPNSMFNGKPLVSVKLEGVETIGSRAFLECKALTTVDFGNSVKTIDEFAFAVCEQLQNFTLTNSLTSIARCAFDGCYSITALNIPSSINAIGLHAFQGCVALEEVTVNWLTPLSITSNDPFYLVDVSNIKLNVPIGTEELYKTAMIWKSFYISPVNSYYPKVIANNGGSTITLYGGQLNESATVWLTQGAISVPATSVNKALPGEITANFELNNVLSGMYDLHVLQAGVIDTVFTEGIEVQGVIYPKVISHVTGASLFRSGFASTAHLVLENTGNIDALGVNAYIAVPDYFEVTSNRTDFREVVDPDGSFDFYCEAFGQSYSVSNERIIALMDEMNYDNVPVDTVHGHPYDGKIYQIYVPKIDAGSTVRIPIKLKALTNADGQIVSAVDALNTFNTLPGESVVPAALVRLNELLALYIGSLNETALQNADSEDVFVNTFEVAKAIGRKLLSEDKIYLGYNESTWNENYFYDQGILRKQLAALILVLEEISKNNSINQRADGIINFAASPPINHIVSRAPANSSSPESRVQTVQNFAQSWTGGDCGDSGSFKNLKTIIRALINRIPFVGGQLNNDLDATAHAVNWGTRYNNRVTNAIYDSQNITGPGTDWSGGGGNGDCGSNTQPTSSRGSLDPNDITGPTGITENRYIAASSEMNYLIRFENKAEAGLPAVFVNVYDTLDVNKFDLSTFELGSISIGDTVLQLPSKKTSYYMEYDMRPHQNYLVAITAGLNKGTGVVHWRMETLDPETRCLVEDPEAGFLPPNINAPEGEGSVSFSVKPKNDLLNNTAIVNFADIIFDYNESIRTNLWTNTVDKIHPVSSVTTEQLTESTFKVQCSATDTESGVHYYRLYAKINDGEFFPIGNSLKDEMIFTAISDTLYSFYVESVDWVGNAEQKPAVTETSYKNTSSSIKKAPRVKSLEAYTNNGRLYVDGLTEGKPWAVYSVSGILVHQSMATEKQANIMLTGRGVYVVTTGDEYIKVIY